MNYRIFVEKKPQFDIRSQKMLQELQDFAPVTHLKIYLIYDLFNLDESQYDDSLIAIIDEVTDFVFTELPITNGQTYFATELLPGQFDQRAFSASQCINLVTHSAHHQVQTGELWVINTVDEKTLKEIKDYVINKVDSREKNLNVLALPEIPKPKKVPVIKGFIDYNKEQLLAFYKEWDFAFGFEDLEYIQSYFQKENRNPTETELKVLDTYWSDHCRHTTFMTELEDVEFQGDMAKTVKQVFQRYLAIRKELGREAKPISLMDIGTIAMKYFRAKGKLNDLVISEEINACTIEVEVEVEGKKEDWYLLFKNETHNHPTEIEPFGGASTCVGGAIRDPLSGRAFVYQAMRVSGSGNPLQKIEDTLPGKLPQKKITKRATQGFSSYGNQIGLATGHIAEIYDEGYVAKRMEVGFVAGAVPKDWVKRDSPEKGDVILVVGGKTGRDGVGGATGSSKVQDEDSIHELGAEVQKGDAVEERKIQRLFRNPEVIQLIKKCNDFGAGGVSVAIGEIADSVFIDLDKLPTKYAGLNGTELAISESQERMAVLLAKEDAQKFIDFANQENVQATVVAEVKGNNRMQMQWQNDMIVDLDREFLNSSGVPQKATVKVESNVLLNAKLIKPLTEEELAYKLSELNHCSQKGMIEHFDSHVEQSTVLMPLGGKFQKTPALASVNALPVRNKNTDMVSIATWGYSVAKSHYNPFLMGAYSVVESLAKLTATGGNFTKSRLSFQEYFERLNEEPVKWGKPFQALLGALEAQLEFETPAIGGKDSMSGTFKELNVPPTLISFACVTENIENIISPEFKKEGNYLYLFQHQPQENRLPDFKQLKEVYSEIHQFIKDKKVISAQNIDEGGLEVGLFKMAVGNELGCEIELEDVYFKNELGSLIIESTEALSDENLVPIGKVVSNSNLNINGIEYDIQKLTRAWEGTLESIFPTTTKSTKIGLLDFPTVKRELNIPKINVSNPKVFIPVFPGTNCEYETEKVWRESGAEVELLLFRNRTEAMIDDSVNKFVKAINEAQIINIPGGFSAGDEPDGSAKYIVAVMNNPAIKEAITEFLKRGGLMLGICNGFQALVKSGLLPYGEIRELDETSPTLTFNSIGRHISQIAKIKVVAENTPWLQGMMGEEFYIPFSHGEGRFFADSREVRRLASEGLIATKYIDHYGNTALNMPYNPNGSVFGIEGITDPSGQIYGRMGHPERFRKGLMKNIPEMRYMNIFKNAMDYFKS